MPIPPIGVFLPTVTDRHEPMPDPVAAARHAEELGFESAWVVDQLISGSGVPVLDSVTVVAAAAGATSHIRLAFGVLVAPLRPAVWIAKQVATLQHLSRDRLVLGLGAGGDRHDRSWVAAGIARSQRGRRLDETLRVLRDLIAGNEIDGVQLAPGAAVPPILIGGMADAALRRANTHDGWVLRPVPPDAAREAVARADVPVTAAMQVAITGDPTLPPRDEVLRRMTDPDGIYGMPADAAEEFLLYAGPDEVRERLRAYGDLGACRVVASLVAGD